MAQPTRSGVPLVKGEDNPRRGAAYTLILEHIMTYPGSYPLPARPPNSRAQQLLGEWRAPATPVQGMGSIHPAQRLPEQSPPPVPFPVEAANAQLVSSLMDHISTLPSQPCSLPPIFITSFLRACFPQELHLVDFPQSLIGLDYLKDLERRRHREISAAKKRLDVDDAAARADPDYVSRLPVGVATWYREMKNAQNKLEALYTQIYVGLRRWIIINELTIVPLNKHNALAMLNTLLPHIDPKDPKMPPPTSHLVPSVLQHQREGFLKYIDAVETHGTSALRPLMNHGKPASAPRDVNGWPSVAQALEKYLRITIRTIEDASCVASRDDLELPSLTPPRPDIPHEAPVKRKADSGVSVTSGAAASNTAPATPDLASAAPSNRHSHPNPIANSTSKPAAPASAPATARPSTSSSSYSHTRGLSGNNNINVNDTSTTTTTMNNRASARSSMSTKSDKNKALPAPPPGATVFASAAAPGAAVKNFSRLEKIAVEIRAFRMRRQTSAQSQTQTQQTTPAADDDKENAAPSIPATAEDSSDIRTPTRPGVPRSKTSTDPHPRSNTPRPVTPGSTANNGTPGSNDSRGRALRALRSLGDLRSRARAQSTGRSRSRSRAGDDSSARASPEAMDVYDREEMLRQRALYQARHSPGH